MSLLATHLEQITLSSQSISSLPFLPPKIFTNALLAPHDITTLIRDTEPHERALFSVPPPPPSQPSLPESKSSSRRQTVFNVASGEVTAGPGPSARAPRRNTAVAAVLGGELHSAIKRNETGPKNGEIDVEVLLKGAERLGSVYALPGAKEEIARLRVRYGQLRTSLNYYEGKVDKQRRELERMNKPGHWEEEEENANDDNEPEPGDQINKESELEITDEDLWREEEEIRELERRKKELEDRVSGMERDLGGLLR